MSSKSFRDKAGTLQDYVFWRGDLSFAQAPWNDIDSLIIATIAYANFGENERSFDDIPYFSIGDVTVSKVLTRYEQKGLPAAVKFRNELLHEMAETERFRDVRILEQINDVDPARNIQFSALTLDVPGVGIVIGYRGTDPSVVGWKEDFMLSYVSPVPAQSAALSYLEHVASKTDRNIYLTGHSKGGNLAIYSASHADPQIQSRLTAVCSFDGPGMDDATMASQGYLSIQHLIHSTIPSDSVIGLLMNYHDTYRVVEASTSSFIQHEPMTWLVHGGSFLEREQVSVKSQILDRSMHEWLNQCSMEQRESFVNTVFSIFEKKEKSEAEPEKPTDDISTQQALSLIYRLIVLQAGNSYTVRVKQPILRAAEELRDRLKGEQRDQSEIILIDNQEHGYRSAVEEAAQMAQKHGLGRKESLRLQLFVEEMMSLIHGITGDVNGSFWIEEEKNRYDLHLTTRTLMDKKKRELLINSSSARKNDAAKSFLGKLRNAFEEAMISDSEHEYFALASDRERMKAKGSLPDQYEQSVLSRLADDIRIGIRGNQVSMIVTIVFA